MIKYVNAPVFIIHGTDDEIIPFSHAIALKSAC
jgi:predicted esterase